MRAAFQPRNPERVPHLPRRCTRAKPWRTNGIRTAGVVIGLVALLCAPAARAKNFSTAPTYDLQLFHPAIDSKGYVTLNASQVLGLWDFSIGLVGTIAGNPLQLEGNGTSLRDDFLFTTVVQAALGFKYAELAVTVPVQINSGGADPTYTSTDGKYSDGLRLSGAGLGDIGVHLKSRILNTSKYPVGLAVLVSAYLPYASGSGQYNFTSDGAFGLAPQIIIDKEFGRQRRFRAALNVGAHLRFGGTHTFTDNGQSFIDPTNNQMVCAPTGSDGICGTGQSRSVGHQVTYGLGASYGVVKDRFDVVAEVYGAAGLGQVDD